MRISDCFPLIICEFIMAVYSVSAYCTRADDRVTDADGISHDILKPSTSNTLLSTHESSDAVFKQNFSFGRICHIHDDSNSKFAMANHIAF